jgi:hypothetical protein
MSNESIPAMNYRWMPIFGEFETSAEPIVFNGRPIDVPEQPEPVASVGILLSDQKMLNGSLRATVEFTEITRLSVCELIVHYDPKTKGQITAGLGGSGMMFSIRQWVPRSPDQPAGVWNNHELAGDRANLRRGVPYDIAVRTQGSVISLAVNGVKVLTTTLPFGPSQAGQTGIFCASQSDIMVSNFTAENERSKAFIVMQFSSPYDEVYSHVIKDACGEFDPRGDPSGRNLRSRNYHQGCD